MVEKSRRLCAVPVSIIERRMQVAVDAEVIYEQRPYRRWVHAVRSPHQLEERAFILQSIVGLQACDERLDSRLAFGTEAPS